MFASTSQTAAWKVNYLPAHVCIILHKHTHPVNAELSGGAFKACRFARDAQKGLFTVVNHQGSGHLLYWQQDALGEMTLVRQTKANSFAAPITAFDISPRGTFLGTGTSEGICG